MLKKHEEHEDKYLHFLYSHLNLDLMRPLLNYWYPLTHTSHCMTISRSAVATQMTARVSPAMHHKYFYARCPPCHNPSYFEVRRLAQTMLACIP